MKEKRDIVYFGLYVLLIVGFYEYGIQKIYGFSILGDEFGYWANAAVLAGYDWSSCAQASAYYSYGYGILLAIPLVLCKTPLSAYRMAVGMNALFLCGAFWFLQKILQGLFTHSDRDRRVFSLLAAAFYPVSLYYMKMTLTETLLFFLYCCVCYLMQQFLKESRRRDLFGLMAVLVYIVFCTYAYCWYPDSLCCDSGDAWKKEEGPTADYIGRCGGVFCSFFWQACF